MVFINSHNIIMTNKYTKKYNPYLSLSNINTTKYNPIIGSNLGIPLNIIQFLYTYEYYNKNIVNFELFFLQIAIGIFTYGSDRMIDALTYQSENANTNNNTLVNNYINNSIDVYSLDKINYYEYLLDNYSQNIFIILSSFIFILNTLLESPELYPIIILLLSTLKYKDFKQNFGEFKALYIGIFWTISTIILPSVYYSNNYDILSYYNLYISNCLSVFASSNIMDIKDIDEDKKDKINTLPVVYGKENAIAISHFAIMTSIYIFLNNDEFDLNNISLTSLLILILNFALFFI